MALFLNRAIIYLNLTPKENQIVRCDIVTL